MKRPKVSSICHNWKHWAEAKLAPEFQGIGRPPAPEPAPADPETDRECRAVVAGFLADYRAWELRWLAVRPLGSTRLQLRPRARRRGDPGRHSHSQRLYSTRASRFRKPSRTASRTRTRDYFAFWKDPRLKKILDVGPNYAPAMAERSAIFAKYMTAWAVRSQGDCFTLNNTPRFDPETFGDVSVYRGDDETAYVGSSHIDATSYQGDRRVRFLLKREDGAWRIERLQISTADKPFRSKTIA